MHRRITNRDSSGDLWNRKEHGLRPVRVSDRDRSSRSESRKPLARLSERGARQEPDRSGGGVEHSVEHFSR